MFSVLSMLSKLPPGGWVAMLNKGGGSNRLPGLVTKQQVKLWNLHRYWLVYIIICLHTAL